MLIHTRSYLKLLACLLVYYTFIHPSIYLCNNQSFQYCVLRYNASLIGLYFIKYIFLSHISFSLRVSTKSYRDCKNLADDQTSPSSCLRRNWPTWSWDKGLPGHLQLEGALDVGVLGLSPLHSLHLRCHRPSTCTQVDRQPVLKQ